MFKAVVQILSISGVVALLTSTPSELQASLIMPDVLAKVADVDVLPVSTAQPSHDTRPASRRASLQMPTGHAANSTTTVPSPGSASAPLTTSPCQMPPALVVRLVSGTALHFPSPPRSGLLRPPRA
jgi:hypothetical protein